jgi:hypothetical protein
MLLNNTIPTYLRLLHSDQYVQLSSIDSAYSYESTRLKHCTLTIDTAICIHTSERSLHSQKALIVESVVM